MYLGLRVESDVALVVDGVPLHALLGLDLVEAGDRAVTEKIKKKKKEYTDSHKQKKFKSRFLPVYPYVHVDVLPPEERHVLHPLRDGVARGAEPERVDGGLGVHEREALPQLAQVVAKVLSEEKKWRF